jgi:cytochrome c-type biogenesis protein CcsB
MYNTIENFLTNFSFLTLFLSMIIYWVEISNVTIANTAEAKTDTKGSTIALSASNVLSVTNTAKISFGQYGMLISNVTIFLLLVLRWKESGHFPLSNLYESLMFLSWTLTTIHIGLDYLVFWGGEFNKLALGTTNTLMNKNKLFIPLLLGSITSPSALLTNAFAAFSLPKEMQEASPLVPALQSNWLMMHVTVMILSYGALILGSLLSVAFLVITGGNELSNLNKTNAIALNQGFENSNDNAQSVVQSEKSELYKLAETFDNLSYRILGIGFPFLTIGILSGAVWANEAWGSYWRWDPKETWALLTWLVFAIYLHTRLNKGWEGKKPALIATLGLVSVWICYLGVNLLGEGLHSYGWFTQNG